MTQPRLAQLSLWGASNAFAEGRAYRDPITTKQYPSITTILRLMPKNLEQYAANEMLKFCIDNWQDLGRKSDADALRSYKYMWRKHADLRGHVGDGIHNYLEAEQTGSWDFPELDAEQELILENWRRLNDAHDIVPLRNEITVGHDEVGYMGTYDSYCLLDGVLTMVDFKTSRLVHESAFLQLGALAFAKQWFIEVEEMKWEAIEPEPITQAAVFHLRADEWGVHIVPDLDLQFEKFKYYSKVWHLNEELRQRAKAREGSASGPSTTS